MRFLFFTFCILIVYVLELKCSIVFNWDEIVNRQNLISAATTCTSELYGKIVCNGDDECTSNGFTICLGAGQQISLNCSETQPYCVKQSSGEVTCSAAPPSSCSTVVEQTSCTSEGIFPDPLDCKKFSYCYKENNAFKSQSGSCLNGYVFDPDAPSFCRYTNNFYCTLPDCRNANANNYALFLYPFYPYNRQYVALCLPNLKPLVFTCPNGYRPNISTFPLTCIFRCVKPGMFPYDGNSTLYNQCTYDSQQKLVHSVGSCFFGWTFVENRCVPHPSTTSTSTTTVVYSTTTSPYSTTTSSDSTTISSDSTTTSSDSITTSSDSTTTTLSDSTTISSDSTTTSSDSTTTSSDSTTTTLNDPTTTSSDFTTTSSDSTTISSDSTTTTLNDSTP